MLDLIIWILASIFLHELGHIIAIVICNISTGRKWNCFEITFLVNKVSIAHLKFSKKNNIFIAVLGPVFPLIFVLACYSLNLFAQSLGFAFLLSLIHLLFLSPYFRDGRNIMSNL